MAEDAAAADTVVFLDADLEPGAARIEPLEAAAGFPRGPTHSLSPSQLVTLAQRLFSFQGKAFLCRVPGEDFSAGLGLSAQAEANAQAAARLLRSEILR
jgi:Ni,Fe-hydrogenase maturation factor